MRREISDAHLSDRERLRAALEEAIYLLDQLKVNLLWLKGAPSHLLVPPVVEDLPRARAQLEQLRSRVLWDYEMTLQAAAILDGAYGKVWLPMTDPLPRGEFRE